MAVNPYQQYQATAVQTASTGDLILLLYDGAIRFLARAELALEQHQLDAASTAIVRGQDIILELNAGLDFEQGGSLAENLRDLYLFMWNTLVQANVKKDAAQIQTVIRLLDRLRGAWRTVIHGEPALATRQGATTFAGGMAA